MATAEQLGNVAECCEACSGGDATVATVYCVECQQKLCLACQEEHKKFKVTRRHKTLALYNEFLSPQLPLSTCDRHVDKYLEIYCVDCELAICTMCCVNGHNKHKCSDVTDIADEFRKPMASDVDKTTVGAQKCREMLTKIEEDQKDFIGQVEKAEVEIGKKVEQLKQMIDDHNEKLMKELSSIKGERMKNIESLREEIEERLSSMESYKKEVDEMTETGTSSNIATAATGLHRRAGDLLKFDLIQLKLDDLGHTDVKFTSAESVTKDVTKTLKHLRLNTVKTGLILLFFFF